MITRSSLDSFMPFGCTNCRMVLGVVGEYWIKLLIAGGDQRSLADGEFWVLPYASREGRKRNYVGSCGPLVLSFLPRGSPQRGRDRNFLSISIPRLVVVRTVVPSELILKGSPFPYYPCRQGWRVYRIHFLGGGVPGVLWWERMFRYDKQACQGFSLTFLVS